MSRVTEGHCRNGMPFFLQTHFGLSENIEIWSGDDDIRAGFSECEGRRESDAGSAAGDESSTAIKTKAVEKHLACLGRRPGV